MRREMNKFSKTSYKASGHVTYGDNNKSKIMSIGKVKGPPSIDIVHDQFGLNINCKIMAFI